MSDLISREAVLEFEEYVGEPATWDKPYPKGDLYVKSEIIERIPSAEPEWIPVSERLPEDWKDVLVWFEYFRYGDYNCMYSTYGIGNYSNQYDSWLINHETGWTDLHVFAWMPLPEPWKGEKDGN